MSDDLKQALYGRTAKVKLADGNEYILREPDIDTLETIEISPQNINEVKTIRKIAWAALEQDNPNLTQINLGKLITYSMLQEGSDFLNSILDILGKNNGKK